MEKSDGGLQNRLTSELSGLTGGARSKGNGNGNGKHKQEQQKVKQLEHSVFKYSSRFRGPLHESIMLGSGPFFLTYSGANGHLGLVRQIEENNRILVPPSIEEHPYEPIEFSSKREIKDYEEMALNETIDSLYQKLKSVVKLYIDQDAEIVILITADIIWTHFQDLYPTTHYYDVTGKENGIGKSTIGYLFEAIGYRGVRMTDPSAANLYRILGKIEPGQCTIIADEADRIHQDKDMLSILKEGYAIGGKVPKINTNTLKQEFFYCYGFKIRIAEESLRSNITKGVIDRSFQIKASKGKPTHDIKEVLQPANRNERLEKLHNDLRSLQKLLLAYRLIHFTDLIPDIEIGLEGRDKELCKPLLQLFHNTKAYPEVKSALQAFLDRKNKRKKNSAIEPVIYGLVVDLVSRIGRTVTTSEIWNAITSGGIPGSYDSKKPNEYQTQDYDTIYRNTVGKIISDNFGAEPKHMRDGNAFVFDLEKLAKAGRVYDIEVSIQTNLPREGCEGSEGSYGQEEDKSDRGISQEQEQDDNISNDNDIKQQISEEMKEGKLPMPGIGPSQPSQPSHTFPNIHRLGNTDQFGCTDCNLRGDKWFMQEHKCRRGKSKNKVADAAAPTSSGDG
jgi:hypothetical protein